MNYEVEVTPSAEGEYRLMIPTVVDRDGVELDAMSSMTTSKPVEVARIDTDFGLALEVNASGTVNLRTECLSCGGLLSLGGQHARVRSNATGNFTLAIRFDFSYYSGGVARNVFGRSIGGACRTAVNASGSIPSNSDWTILDGEGGGLCWDYFGGDSLLGLIVSFPCYIAGLVFLAAGAWVRKRSPLP